ncbi:DUF6176 family protein [Cellulomonas sp. JZ18]|uniref:DUF6176 family protein n=1 Tax=Cellulomonas sp. JZ18 TaxID=2654191 RepID=UPI0012D435DE|nr:DUF6176 family protein [Cellulomonas sp. JZ18]
MTDVVGLPPGVRVALSRARVRAGASAEADRWMTMLRERHEECLDTLERERMAVEAVFRTREPDGTEHLWWFTLQGEDGAGPDASPHPVDRDHVAHARRTTEPGRLVAEPQVVLLPAPVARAVRAWATGGDDGPSGS